MSRGRRVVHALGLATACAGVAFVAWRWHGMALSFNQIEWSPVRIGGVITLVLVSTLANLLLPLAWRLLLMEKGFGPSRVWAVSVYGRSQLARYVPGNIFHYASRQALGMAAGIAALALAHAALLELALVALAGGAFALLALPLLLPAVGAVGPILLFIAAIVIIALCIQRYMSKVVCRAFLLYLAYVSWSSAGFVLILHSLFPEGPNAVLVGGTYASAWLIGLMTPGAPAGVGVRESVSVALLGNIVATDALVLALLAIRMVGMAADIITFLVALLLSRHKAHS